MNSRLRVIVTCLLLASMPGLAADFPKVRFETTAGNFTIELDDTRAPLTVANFLQYVNDGFYTGTIFHRVIPGFVIQGGGYTADLTAKPTREPVQNESGNGLTNRRLTVAMARTGDPHTADSQFYINLANNLELDPKATRWGYAVFGEVVEGVEVVDDIGYRPTSPQGGFQNLPAAPVIVEQAVVVQPGDNE